MTSILIIDDDRDICLVLSAFLSRSNYAVHTTITGAEGLQQLQENHYDLVLCDYKLPDISGLDLLKQIKTLSPAVAIIIITGYSDIKTAVETLRYGADDYITKPLYPQELLVNIKETIAKNQAKLNHNHNLVDKVDNKMHSYLHEEGTNLQNTKPDIDHRPIGAFDILPKNIGLLKSIAWTAERQAIVDVLVKVSYNKSKAAELLNIDRKTLYNKLKLYNISQQSLSGI